MNNSFAIKTGDNNTVIITSGETELQFPKNSLYIISDNTDVLLIRSIGSRKNTVELVWSWLSGATSKSNAIETINGIIFGN